LVMTKDDLEDLRGQRDEAIQEHWIENQVKLKARLLLEVGLYIHEGRWLKIAQR
jgi:hypothetical protein